tara:strand:+ start:163 stop:399 length:237 start_codon:yes stop_codon:yes gene_type:complete
LKGNKMAKKENKQAMLNLDGNEYVIDDMNDEQKVMVSHIADLTRKMETMNFNMQQLEFGKQAFVNALKKTLEEVTEEK